MNFTMIPRDDIKVIFDSLTLYPWVLEIKPSSSISDLTTHDFFIVLSLLGNGGEELGKSDIAPQFGWDYDWNNKVWDPALQIGFEDEHDYNQFVFGSRELVAKKYRQTRA